MIGRLIQYSFCTIYSTTNFSQSETCDSIAYSSPLPRHHIHIPFSHNSVYGPAAMDKMSRFRRRPKPPTIETDVHRPSTTTTSSPLSGLSAMSAISTRNAETVNGHEQWNKPSGKKPILHNLRLRASGKRARGISPASLESSPVPVVVGHDGSPLRTTEEDDNASDASRQSKPRMPHFLTLSSQGGPKLLVSITLHNITWRSCWLLDRVLTTFAA